MKNKQNERNWDESPGYGNRLWSWFQVRMVPQRFVLAFVKIRLLKTNWKCILNKKVRSKEGGKENSRQNKTI